MSAVNPGLAIPLDGVRLIEASAGTGKTFTIATIYNRLVLTRGLMPADILVVTFTNAAAKELAERLHARLALAERVLAQDEPARERDDDDGALRVTRAVVADALRTLALDALRVRCRDARLSMDEAAIGTIHGYCQRVLAEAGFDAGRPLAPIELLENERALVVEATEDAWRHFAARGRSTAERLAALWGRPETLARKLDDARWEGRRIVAGAPPDRARVDAEIEAARRALVETLDEAGVRGAGDEWSRCISHGGAAKSRRARIDALAAWSREGDAPVDDPRVRAVLADLDPTAMSELKSLKQPPCGPVFDALAALVRAQANLTQVVAAENVELLLALRIDVRKRLAARKDALGLQSFQDLIARLADALAGPHGEALAARLRRRHPCALVDEFQDTDPLQWDILRKLYVDTGATLFMIGDPKQAIYAFRGGDVHTYLRARAAAIGAPLALASSFRSGARLIDGLNALFAAPSAFVDGAIEHGSATSDASVAARGLLIGGERAPGIGVWAVEPAEDGKPWPKREMERRLIDACVAAIVDWLTRATRGDVAIVERDGKTRALAAGDIAVLVADNYQAARVQAALASAGVPAVSQLRASVFATPEAEELERLLAALLDPGDAKRLRAALATTLLGYDAPALVAFEHDATRWDELLDRFQTLHLDLERRGLLPVLHALIAAAAPRVLALVDGARRLTNYLQLAECLQVQSAVCFAPDELLTYLARQRRDADNNAEASQLRLESDGDAVQVATVHAVKGLEFGVVLAPFAAFGRDAQTRANLPYEFLHDADGAPIVVLGDALDAACIEAARREALGEQARLLYVALTRAKYAAFTAWGSINLRDSSGLGVVLAAHGDADNALAQLEAQSRGAIARLPLPNAAAGTRFVAVRDPTAAPRAREFVASVERDWRIWSYTRLANTHARAVQAPERAGAGDDDRADDALGLSLAGPRYGQAVHAVFEHADFAAWQKPLARLPARETELVRRELARQGLLSASDGDVAVARVATDVRATLMRELPCGIAIGRIVPERRRAEMSFHLGLGAARLSDVYATLHAHGYQRDRSAASMTRLHGLLTGVIDLVFEHEGRYHVVDYKTNRLPRYDAATLARAIVDSDYDLQYLLYVVALHRWLGRVLPRYDYERHVGDVYYVFVRGVAAGGGVFRDRPPRALIEALDATLGVGEAAA